MRRQIFILTGIIVLSLSACEKYIILKPEIEEGVSFSLQIQPIFDDKCLKCHSRNLKPILKSEESYDALIDGDYVDTNDPEASIIYQELRESHDSRATEEEKLFILQWITEGALNN